MNMVQGNILEENRDIDTAQPESGFVRRMAPMALIAVGLIVFFVLGGRNLLSFDALAGNREQLLQWYHAHQVLTVAAFWALYILAVAFSLPGATVLTLFGGFVFGTWFAFLYVISAATVGSVGIFLAARYAFRNYMKAKAGKWIGKFEAGFHEDALSYMLVLRLVPVFPFWLVNLVPALIGVRLRTYVIGTFFGIIPGSWVYCSVGNGLGAVIDRGDAPDLGLIFEPQILAPIIGLAILSLVPVVYKRYRKARARTDGSDF